MSSEQKVIIAPGKTLALATGKKHELHLPPDWMTVCFLLDSAGQVELAYPKYVLESSDGAYKKELSAKNDLVPGDAYLQLKFEDLLPGKRYTLTRFDDAELSHVVFKNKSYGEIVDQERSMHDDLVEHAYAEFDFADAKDKHFDDWEAAS